MRYEKSTDNVLIDLIGISKAHEHALKDFLEIFEVNLNFIPPKETLQYPILNNLINDFLIKGKEIDPRVINLYKGYVLLSLEDIGRRYRKDLHDLEWIHDSYENANESEILRYKIINAWNLIYRNMIFLDRKSGRIYFSHIQTDYLDPQDLVQFEFLIEGRGINYYDYSIRTYCDEEECEEMNEEKREEFFNNLIRQNTDLTLEEFRDLPWKAGSIHGLG